MAWGNPKWYFLHAARAAGASLISAQNTFATDTEHFLIDDRLGSLCTFTGAATDHHIQIDRGAGTLEEIDRLIIPVGHNFNGENVRIRTDDNAGFSSPISILSQTAITSAGLINLAATSGTAGDRTARYVRFDWPASSSTNWTIPELILTRERTTTRGPDPRWRDEKRSTSEDFQKASGVISTLQPGVDLRFIEMDYRIVKAADFAVFDELLDANGTSIPFYLQPAYTTESLVWMKMESAVRRNHDEPAPAANDESKRYVLSMLENIA